MKTLYLEDSPISYCIDDSAKNGWVVFVHAAFADHRMFEKQFRYFSGKYNLLAVDILGHGNSTDTKRGDRIERMAFWMNRILEKHGISAAHLVGISLGSVLVQDFADKYAEKVLSAACFGGYDIHDFDAEKQKSNTGHQIGMMLKAMISVKWFAKSTKKISAYTPAAQEDFYKMNIRFPKKSFRYLSTLQNLINKHTAGPRRYALLVGCGEHDIPAEIELVNEWAEKQNCKKAILKGAGHCANMDVPEEFNRCLEKFWQECESDE